MDHFNDLGKAQLGREEGVSEGWGLGLVEERGWRGVWGRRRDAHFERCFKGRGMVWHARIPVAQNIFSGQGRIELLLPGSCIVRSPLDFGKTFT